MYPLFSPPQTLAKPSDGSSGDGVHSRSTGDNPSDDAGSGVHSGGGGDGHDSVNAARSAAAGSVPKSGVPGLSGGGVAEANNGESGPSPERSRGYLAGVAAARGVTTGHPDIPPVFVVNAQLPDVPTPLTIQGDGPTIHVLFVFRATERLCRWASRVWAEDNGGGGGDGDGNFEGKSPAAKVMITVMVMALVVAKLAKGG